MPEDLRTFLCLVVARLSFAKNTKLEEEKYKAVLLYNFVLVDGETLAPVPSFALK